MFEHLLSIDKYLWCAVTEGPFIHKGDDDVVKHPKDWDDAETKKVSYDLKVRNILISTLGAKVFYLISHHMNVKGMLDALKLSMRERRTSGILKSICLQRSLNYSVWNLKNMWIPYRLDSSI